MKAIRLLLIPLLALATTGQGSDSIRGERLALAVLDSDASIQEKALACQELAVTGGPESVPALTALLDDKALSSYARTALEVIKDPSAGEALLTALTAVKGELLVGIATSLGVRGDAAAVPALQKLVAEPKRGAAQAALTALAHIGTEDALATIVKTLEKGSGELHVPSAHAALLAADLKTRQGENKAAQNLLKAVRAANVPEHIKQAATL